MREEIQIGDTVRRFRGSFDGIEEGGTFVVKSKDSAGVSRSEEPDSPKHDVCNLVVIAKANQVINTYPIF